jgi:hypothetical protein
MVEIEVFKVLVPYSDTGQIDKADAIEYQGKIWLVPQWNEYPSLGVKKPARIVHLGPNGLKPSKFAGCRYIAEVLLLPKAVFDGNAPPQAPIEVLDSPDISFRIPVGSDLLH